MPTTSINSLISLIPLLSLTNHFLTMKLFPFFWMVSVLITIPYSPLSRLNYIPCLLRIFMVTYSAMSSVAHKINPRWIYPMLVLTSPTKDPPTMVAVVAVTHPTSLPIVAANSVRTTNVDEGVVGKLIPIPPIDQFAKCVKSLIMQLCNAIIALTTPIPSKALLRCKPSLPLRITLKTPIGILT